PDPHVHVVEPGRGDPVADPAVLEGLALAAVGDPPHDPALRPADGGQRPPELGGAAVVGGVAVQPAEAAALDLPGRLDAELEVDPAVVDRPGAVDAQQEPGGGVGPPRGAPWGWAAPSSSGLPWPGSRLTLVMRISGMLPQPSARMAPPE